MAKKTSPKVAHGWARYKDGVVQELYTGVTRDEISSDAPDYDTAITVLPRARYRALLRAEKERDEMRDAWPKGCYQEMLTALSKPAPKRGRRK